MSDDITPEDVVLRTGDGLDLEAQLVVPEPSPIGVVLTHPHPRYGGDMHSLVTGELFRALPRAGLTALRFNFRGVGRSEGQHGEGVDEALDIVAAVDALSERAPDLPLFVAGWSFGADVALGLADPRLLGWFAVAPPLGVVEPAGMVAARDDRPKVLVIPEHDQFNAPERARQVVAGWASTRVVVVTGADHFLAGRTDRVTELCLDLANELL